MQQELEGGVGKNYEGEGLRRIVSQGNSGQVRERKDLSRIHFGEHGDRIARGYQLLSILQRMVEIEGYGKQYPTPYENHEGLADYYHQAGTQALEKADQQLKMAEPAHTSNLQ